MSDYTVDSLYQRYVNDLRARNWPPGADSMDNFISDIECHLEDGSTFDHLFSSDEFDFLCRELVYNTPAS